MPIVVQLLIALAASAGISFSLDRLERGKWWWQEYTPENPFTWSRFVSPF